MIKSICEKAKNASYELVAISDKKINELLITISDTLLTEMEYVLKENEKDIEVGRNNGISEVMIDRLKLTEERLSDIASSIKEIAEMPSYVSKIEDEWTLKNGIEVKKMRVPFGVVAMIYESRPNVTIDAGIIALKTKNAIVLKGGKEAINSNRALVKILKKACLKLDINPDVIGFVDSINRAHADELLHMKGYIDLLIPRGSANLINWVTENAKVPVIETGAGNCHIFVDESADFDMAISIIDNAKTQRPSVCNAAEKVIVHRSIAKTFIPKMIEHLEDRVSFRVHESAKEYFDNPHVMSEEETYREYLDYILGVIVLNSVEEAIRWINTRGTHHSDAIITENIKNAALFETVVDSAAVYHNASTRFTDGGEFGFGAEIGIATSKLHARGPMALREMTTYKYILQGKGEIRS